MIDRRTRSAWKFSLAAWIGGIGVMLAPRLLFGVSAADEGTSRVMITTIATLIAIGWTFWMAALAFRRLDEFQQEAGKFAWYWGGSMGIALSAVGYAFIGLGGLHWLDPAHFAMGKDLYRSFQIGYVVGMGCPVLGFLAVRLWWQVAKR
jgi:hypothetical protein